jgi:hypothetical protein
MQDFNEFDSILELIAEQILQGMNRDELGDADKFNQEVNGRMLNWHRCCTESDAAERHSFPVRTAPWWPDFITMMEESFGFTETPDLLDDFESELAEIYSYQDVRSKLLTHRANMLMIHREDHTMYPVESVSVVYTLRWMDGKEMTFKAQPLPSSTGAMPQLEVSQLGRILGIYVRQFVETIISETPDCLHDQLGKEFSLAAYGKVMGAVEQHIATLEGQDKSDAEVVLERFRHVHGELYHEVKAQPEEWLLLGSKGGGGIIRKHSPEG